MQSSNMNLQEYKGPKIGKRVGKVLGDFVGNPYGPDALNSLLRRHGWTCFSMSSKYSNVYCNPKYRYVLKINKRPDIGYENYVQLIHKKRNKHFPHISDRKEIMVGGEKYYAYLIEELFHIDDSRAKHLSSIYRDYIKGRKYGLKIDKIFTDIYWYPAGVPPELRDDPSMINALEIVADNSLLSGEFSIDLHKRNIMEREDGTVVITDPYA